MHLFLNQTFLVIDPQATTVLIVLLLIFILLAFTTSGAQAAFFSFTYKEVNVLKTKQKPAYQRILDLVDEPKILYNSLRTANIFFKIVIIIIVNLLLTQILVMNSTLEYLIKAVVAFAVLLLFCEMIPRMWAHHNNIRFAKDFLVITEAIYYFFKGFGRRMTSYSDSVEKRLNKNHKVVAEDTTDKEKNMYNTIVEFGNIPVRRIMRTRLDVSGIEYKSDFTELINKTEELHYSRFPVYKDDLDNVVGVINTKDILPHLDKNNSYDWHELIRAPYFVHEHKLIEDLLKEFQAKRIHFAFVVDEFGGTSGIVTMEDILEEIIGDIRDEFDDDDSSMKKVDDYNYVFDGRVMVSEACRFMLLPYDTFDKIKGESDSLAGLVLEIAGEIPPINKTVISGDFEFTVLEILKHRLEKIRITIKPLPEKTPQ